MLTDGTWANFKSIKYILSKMICVLHWCMFKCSSFWYVWYFIIKHETSWLKAETSDQSWTLPLTPNNRCKMSVFVPWIFWLRKKDIYDLIVQLKSTQFYLYGPKSQPKLSQGTLLWVSLYFTSISKQCTNEQADKGLVLLRQMNKAKAMWPIICGH